ncbi:MAG: amidohydrolase family protein [Pirellulales bacterium]|nr:amidohydrolase family protein [Pirellulales bacterium]
MAVEQVAGMHVSWPRGSGGRSSGNDAIKRIRETFATARAYMQAREADESTPFDAKWEGMIPVLKGELPVFIAANSESEISNAVAFADQENISCVIVGGSQADKCSELLKRNDVPVIISKVHRLPSGQDAAYDDAFTLPKRLQNAGVVFAISSGEGAANVRNLPFNAGTAAAFGLSSEDALKSITLSAAEILGVGDRLGSLTAGKDANVVIANGDILEVTTNVEMAFIGGSMVDLQSKHTLLYDKCMEKYRQMGVLNVPQ